MHIGTSQEFFCLRGVRLNLFEFTWSVKLLLSPISVGAGRQAWLSFVVLDTFSVLKILSYPVSTIRPAHHGWARRTIFKIKVLR